MPKIILLGYMGSGKSTTAEALAAKTGLPHIDLDALIENRAGSTMPELFASKGEIWFRKTEHLTLRELLHSPDSYILSLGGGTPCYANNHELIFKPEVISVYLKASIPTLSARLQPSLSSRPLVATESEETLTDFISKHLFERRYFYEMATFSVKTDDKDTTAIVNEIVDLIENTRI